MLVLTRKVGEKLHIGENVVITVTAVDGNKVRLGITAPSCVNVWRSELWESWLQTPAEPCASFPSHPQRSSSTRR
jgi:carbon storage regulator CsrA